MPAIALGLIAALYIPHSNDKCNFEFVSGAFRVAEFCSEWEIPQYVPSSPKTRALQIYHSNNKLGARNKLSNAVLGFRFAIEDGTMKKRAKHSSLLESVKALFFVVIATRLS